METTKPSFVIGIPKQLFLTKGNRTMHDAVGLLTESDERALFASAICERNSPF